MNSLPSLHGVWAKSSLGEGPRGAEDHHSEQRADICSGDLRLPKEDQEAETNTAARSEQKTVEKSWYVL